MRSSAALLLIDAQVNMFDPASPVDDSVALLARLRALLGRAREAGIPVVFVRNTGGPGWALHPELRPTAEELVLDKTTCDAFASTNLAAALAVRGVEQLVLAGLQSDFCIRETTQGALALGYVVTLVSDGHSTYDGRTRTARESAAAVNDEFAGRATLALAGGVDFRD